MSLGPVGTKEAMDWLRQAAAMLCSECGCNWRAAKHSGHCSQRTRSGPVVRTELAGPALREAVYTLLGALDTAFSDWRTHAVRAKYEAEVPVAEAWAALFALLEGRKGYYDCSTCTRKGGAYKAEDKACDKASCQAKGGVAQDTQKRAVHALLAVCDEVLAEVEGEECDWKTCWEVLCDEVATVRAAFEDKAKD